jgi:hypothetical protein
MFLGRWSAGRIVDWLSTALWRIYMLWLLELNTTLLTVVSIIGVVGVAGLVLVDGRSVGWDRRILVVPIVVATVATLVIVGWGVVSLWCLASHPSRAVHGLDSATTTTAGVDASSRG